MNRLDLLPTHIKDVIYMYAFDTYYDDYNAFLIYKYDCNLKLIKHYFTGPKLNIKYIYCTYNDKNLYQLYNTIMIFNLKHKYPINIKQSLTILNSHLKKI